MKCKLILPDKVLYFHALHEMRRYTWVNHLWHTYLYREDGRLVFTVKERKHAQSL